MNVEKVVIGMGLGLASNFAWEYFKLPGYGVPVLPLNPTTSLGADDVALVGIGGALYAAKQKEIGIGFMLSQLGMKILEMFGISLYPVIPTTVASTGSMVGF